MARSDVIQCLTPKKPRIRQNLTGNFGLPKGVSGRGSFTPKAIVIHCVKHTLEAYDALVCRDLKLKRGAIDHPSLHYVITGEGAVVQYVEDLDIAWAFPEVSATPNPDLSTFNWSLTTQYPNVSPDWYTINIGLTIPPSARGECLCEGISSPLRMGGEKKLIQLIAYLSAKYNIPVTKQAIVYHHNIDLLAEEECPCDGCIVCDVAKYCEQCENPSMTQFENGIVKYVYGESEDECTVAQDICDVIDARLRALGVI